MDSVTQLALGAAVGYAVLGRRVGRRAIAWGAVCGTLPDLDTLYPFATDVAAFTWHRGYSHSLAVLTLISPLLAWLIWRMNLSRNSGYAGWLGLVFLVLITHPILDCFTVYGTQVLLPFSDLPVSWSTIFIIDPLYTLPVLIGVVFALVRNDPTGRRINAYGLALGCAYLAFSVGAKWTVESNVSRNLVEQQLAPAHTEQDILSMAAPFNTLLWRVMVRDGDDYLEGYDSLLDGSEDIVFRRRPVNGALLEGSANPDIDRLKWFAHGHYAADLEAGKVKLCDLRMGLIDQFVFCFYVGKTASEELTPIYPAIRQASERRRLGPTLRWLWERIWQPGKPPPTIESLAETRS